MPLTTSNTVKSQPASQQVSNNKSALSLSNILSSPISTVMGKSMMPSSTPPVVYKQNYGIKTTTPMTLPQPIAQPRVQIASAPVAQTKPAPKVQTTPLVSTPPTAKPLVSSPTVASSPSYSSPSTGLISFPGLINSLGNQQGSSYNESARGSIGSLKDVSATNPATSGPAFDAYQKAVENEKKLKSDIATSYGNIEQTPIPLEFQQGREQVLARQYASQLDAAQQAVVQQQKAIDQQIAGTQTQQTGFNLAGGLANTGQGNTNSALGTAAGYSQPTVGAFGQTQYSPLNAGQNSNNPYGTGPEAGANVQSVMEQTKAVNDLSAARNSANTIVQNQLTPFLAQNGVNPSDFNAINKFLQSIGAQTSSVGYKTFINIINDLANTYSQVLTPPGGSTTDMTRSIAQSMIDATASGQSIQQVVQALDSQAQSKIAGIQSNVNNLNSGQNVNPSQTNNSSAPLGWGWNP